MNRVVGQFLRESPEGRRDGFRFAVHVERARGGGVVDDAGSERVVEKRALADGLAGGGCE